MEHKVIKMELKMYKIYKLVGAKFVHIGNVRAKDSTQAKRVYTKQAGLPASSSIGYRARMFQVEKHLIPNKTYKAKVKYAGKVTKTMNLTGKQIMDRRKINSKNKYEPYIQITVVE